MRGSRPADDAGRLPPAQGAWASRTRASPCSRSQTEAEVAAPRRALDVRPVFKRIDTCAAEFASPTAYMYSTYARALRRQAGRRGAARPTRKKVVILGGGPEPHRPGHRVRLLLLPCLLRAERRRLRDHHGQLQPGDGLDRLRHLRPALFRAADRRGRARDPRDRAAERHAARRHRAVRRPDPAEARPRARGGRHPDPRHLARRHRPRRGPRPLQAPARQARH